MLVGCAGNRWRLEPRRGKPGGQSLAGRITSRRACKGSLGIPTAQVLPLLDVKR